MFAVMGACFEHAELSILQPHRTTHNLMFGPEAALQALGQEMEEWICGVVLCNPKVYLLQPILSFPADHQEVECDYVSV